MHHSDDEGTPPLTDGDLRLLCLVGWIIGIVMGFIAGKLL